MPQSKIGRPTIQYNIYLIRLDRTQGIVQTDELENNDVAY